MQVRHKSELDPSCDIDLNFKSTCYCKRFLPVPWQYEIIQQSYKQLPVCMRKCDYQEKCGQGVAQWPPLNDQGLKFNGFTFNGECS